MRAGDHHERRACMLDGIAKAIPPGQRNLPQGLRRNFAQIERYRSEASRVKNPVGRCHCMVRAASASHPENPVKTHAVGCRRRGIETIGSVNQGAGFSLRNGSRKNLMK